MNASFLRRQVRWAVGVCCALALAAVARPASAANMVEIQVSGLDLVYDGSAIYDAAFQNTTRSGDPSESDTLTTMSFLVDGAPVGSVLTTNIFADIYIAGVNNIPSGGGVVMTSGNGDAFGIDLLTINGVPGFGLALNIDEFQVNYTANSISMSTTGVASSLFTQSLPFGVSFDPNQPITIVFSSSSLSNVTTDGDFVTGFLASGTGNIAQTVPEPTGLALAGLGAVVAGFSWFASRRSK